MRALFAAVLTVIIASPALAQPMRCHTRQAVLEHLAKNYQEHTAELGVANNGGIVELFAAKDGKTWTIVITMPNGPTCLLAAGKDWETIPNVLYGEQS
jgi:hypothetical protein